MPGSPCPPTSEIAGAPTAVDPEHLEALASVLLAGIQLDPGDPPRLVRIRLGADDLAEGDVELGLKALETGDHPLDGLVGFRAPADWSALGVLATGKASTGTGPRARPGARRSPVLTAHLVGRDGSWASAWRPRRSEGGPRGSDFGPAATGVGCTGRVDDALRRALGVATAPPAEPTHHLWAAQWLDALVSAAATDPGRFATAAPALALHPAVTAFALDPSGLSLGRVIAEANRLAEWRDWPQLRRACATGSWPQPGVDADLADWFDDGSFARWLLASWPDLTDLIAAVDALLPGEITDIVRQALRAWGVAT